MAEASFKTIATNRRARYDYFIEESYETGIVLAGTEVKSLRQGNCSIKEAWCDINPNMELYIKQMHIAPYEQGNIFNVDPLRPRKLLMHRREIIKLQQLISRQGYTLVPISVYLKNSLVKVQVGLARGKKDYDKRADIAERDAKRTIDRALKERYK